MKRYVVYSSLVGSYDEVHQPLVIDNRFDYVLFTDDVKTDQIGVWQVVSIPYSEGNNMLQSRYAKCHPVKVLRDYEASLYIDANIQIASSEVYDRFFELLANGTEWGGIKHPSQNCIYEEICAIVDLKWVHDYDVVNWYGRMKKVGFPERWGLYENNVIFRSHTKKVEEIGEFWWQTLLKDCKRDQFSLMFSIWKYQPTKDYFLPEGECPRLNSSKFVYFVHNPHKRILRLGLNERIRRKCIRDAYHTIRGGYHRVFDQISRFWCPRLMLFLWGLYTVPSCLILKLKSNE
ncbi:MAG: hypothetical protein IKO88_05790 [Bacteroidales bacterium]|nr:hypothetical protein [Bacteroidales bacterium]